MAKTNIIEINGKKYDAITGVALSKPVASSSHAVKPAVKRQPAKHAAAHTPKPAKTLMRHAVKKPANQAKRHTKAHGPAIHPARQPKSPLEVKKSVHRLDNKRLQQASRVAKSRLIKHFAPISSSDYVAPPVPGSIISPGDKTAVARVAKPATTTADLLEQALHRANAHQQAAPQRKSRKRRAAGISGAAALIILLIGVVVNQNMTSLELQRASAAAGFEAVLPSQRPAGYSLDKVRYSEGVVATSFHSNSDDRSYTLTQKQTSWDSQALLNLLVIPQDQNYQVHQVNEITIYLYGSRNAAWVQDGILYQIQSNGSLSDRQLLALASSL